MGRGVLAILGVMLLLTPLSGSIAEGDGKGYNFHDFQIINSEHTSMVPFQQPIPWFNSLPWWETTSLDSNRDRIHDSLAEETGIVNLGLSYSRDVKESDIDSLSSLGINVNLELPSVDALLIGGINVEMIEQISNLDGVVMVERYGSVVFYGDIQTPAVKAKNSSEYTLGAWDLGVSGNGMNIALVDTGVDNEHPGLSDKFVAGYDAVCYVHSDPTCLLSNPLRRMMALSTQMMQINMVLHVWGWLVRQELKPMEVNQNSMGQPLMLL